MTVSDDEISKAVAALLTTHNEALTTQRYCFQMYQLTNTLRKTMPFADGARLNAVFNAQILALLGEENEEDRKMK